MQPVSAEEFQSKITGALPVVVDFFAEWCGPCKMLSPVLESLAPSYEGKFEVIKVNIDEHSDIAQQYNVTSIPTIVFIKEGQEADRMVGFQSKENLQQRFDKFAG